MEPIGCPETSAKNYRYSLRNDPEKSSSRQKTLCWQLGINVLLKPLFSFLKKMYLTEICGNFLLLNFIQIGHVIFKFKISVTHLKKSNTFSDPISIKFKAVRKLPEQTYSARFSWESDRGTFR